MTADDDLDNLDDTTTYLWSYLADKNGVDHQVIDRVADQLAQLIDMCPSPQRLHAYIDQWATPSHQNAGGGMPVGVQIVASQTLYCRGSAGGMNPCPIR